MPGEREALNRKVRLYSLSTCPVCARVKRLLRSNGVDFEVVDVDTLDSGEQWLRSKELRQYNPKATYPTLVVEEVITDFDEEALKGALGLK
jgi:glutaredoxin